MKVVFITESSHEIGLGHLKRSLSLAFEFEKDMIFDIEIILPMYDKKTQEILEKQRFAYHSASERLDFFLNLDKTSLILIVDVKTNFYDEFLEKMFQKSVKIFGIDDLSYRNTLYTANFSPPAAVMPDAFEFEQREKNYIGWGWVPIHFPSSTVAPNQEKRNEHSALLMFGGSDPEALSALSFDYFGRNATEIDFSLICGPLMKSSAIVECKQISMRYRNLKVLKSPENLSALMNKSFASVTTFGHTFYELIAHGNSPLAIYRDIGDVLGLFGNPDFAENNLISIAQYREMMGENEPRFLTKFWGSVKKPMGSIDPSIQDVSTQLRRGSTNIKKAISSFI